MSFTFLAESVTSGIFYSNSVLSVLYFLPKTRSLISILFTFATNLSLTAFLTTSFFTIPLSLLRSTGTGANLSMSNLSTSVLKLAKYLFLVQKLKYQRVKYF